MEEQVQQMQHPVLKIEQQPGQYGVPVLNTGVGGVNQIYYVLVNPDQSSMISSAGGTSLLQNQNQYYMVNPGNTLNTSWNHLPVIQTSSAVPYMDPGLSEIPIQDPLQTISYGQGTVTNSTEMQGLDGFAAEVVINTEPEGEQSFDSQKFAKPSRECDVCQKVLCNKDSLRRHKKLVHGVDEAGLPEMQESIQVKRNAKQCECQFCGKVLCNRDSLRRHQKVVHKDELAGGHSHSSYKMETSMSEQELLEEAVRSLDDMSGQEHPQQQLYNYNQIETHVVPQPMQKSTRKFVTKTRRKKHPICEICRKPFYNKATLLRHWSTFHKGLSMGEIQTTSVDANSNLTCNLCHRTFFDFATLRRHKVVVHQDNGTSSNQNSGANGKSDPCHLCGKVLYDRGVLRRHLKTVHKIGDGEAQRIAHRKDAGASPKAQTCHVCGKILYDKGVLRRHLKHVHGVENPADPLHTVNAPKPASSQPWPPTKTFARTEIEMDRPPPVIPGLDMPVIETLSPKPNSSAHACEKCEETFANASNLKRHLVIVHKMQIENYEAVLRQHTIHSKMPRSCNICGKTIIGRSNLVRHQQNVHKVGVVKNEPRENNLENAQNDNNHALEQDYMMKCEPEEVVTYSQEHVDHNGAMFPLQSEADIATDHALADNGHEMELDGDGKEIIGTGIGSEVVFDLNEVEECTAKVKQEGETDSNSNEATAPTN